MRGMGGYRHLRPGYCSLRRGSLSQGSSSGFLIQCDCRSLTPELMLGQDCALTRATCLFRTVLFDPMSKKKPYMLFRIPHEADLRFYDGYDPKFLFRKADTLFFVYQNRDEYRKFVETCGGSAEEMDDNYFHGLAAELHCSAMQQSECFFALLLAAFQPLPHWLFLTSYRNEMRERAQALIEEQIEVVTSGICKQPRHFVAKSVYPGVDLPDDPEWTTALDSIFWFISEMGKCYLSGGEYNAYKHGLRVLPGEHNFMVDISGSGDFRTFLSMPHALSYLEIDSQVDGRYVNEVTKQIDPLHAFHSIQIMASIAEVVCSIRLGGLQKQEVQIKKLMIDKDGFASLRPVARFTRSF
jgi:hypothetical protein